jgi:hypothetical protein
MYVNCKLEYLIDDALLITVLLRYHMMMTFLLMFFLINCLTFLLTIPMRTLYFY